MMEIANRDVADQVDLDALDFDDAVDSDGPQTPEADILPERQREILDFERLWWRRPGAKEQAIRDRFNLTPTRYYQLLNTLLDEPAALAYDPATVRRLRRLRASRRR